MKHKHFTPKFLSCLGLGLLFTFGCSKEELTPSESLSASTSQEAASNASNSARLSSNHYIIIASGERLPADIADKAKSANGTVTALLDEVGIASATSDDPGFAAKASKIAGVKSVVRDFTFQGFDPEAEKVVEIDATYGNPPKSGDNDTYFDLQWGHDAINAPEAWNAGYRGKGVRVAVLDSGFDLDHRDLAPNIDLAASKNFVPGEKLSYALTGVGSHGTHTAGTIGAADNGLGIIGVAPESKLILVKVLRDSGSGSFSWMLEGILHAVSQGADVINMSLGAGIPRNGKYLDDNGTPDNPADDFVVSDTKATQELIVAISKVTAYAAKQGVTIIAAAGNDGIDGNKDRNLVQMPADAPHVISISATSPRAGRLIRLPLTLTFWLLTPTTEPRKSTSLLPVVIQLIQVTRLLK
ncbi:S8 family peptidase [Hymenobacter radiodurans]|uniref:S8 family peptidase n=1 Tax=Hymenobacter radiodurans TaxID=2496028 RepID=UPI0021D3D67E|nr:S8 family serine peptidase [Hymenobacter radiodurans]